MRPQYWGSYSVCLVCTHKCGRFHKPQTNTRDQQKPRAQGFCCSVGTTTACTHRQQLPPTFAARAARTQFQNSVQSILDCDNTPNEINYYFMAHYPSTARVSRISVLPCLSASRLLVLVACSC